MYAIVSQHKLTNIIILSNILNIHECNKQLICCTKWKTTLYKTDSDVDSSHIKSCKYVSSKLSVKESPLRSSRVTHLIERFRKHVFFLLLTCVWHISLSCGTLICFCWLAINLKLVLYLLISEKR